MEIPDIKRRLSLPEVLSHYGLTPDKNARLHCPFHEDKTPSLQVYYKTDTAYCFSSNCKTHGKRLDVIDFIMWMEAGATATTTDRHSAIKKAEGLLNGNGQAAVKTELPRTAVLERMYEYFRKGLLGSHPARHYAEGRGLDVERLGYNSGQFHHRGRLDDAGLLDGCRRVGLLINGNKGQSAFGKNCLVFPLKEKTGRIAGLYFRSTVNEADQRHFYLKGRQGLYPEYPVPETKTLVLTESVIDAASVPTGALTGMPQTSVLACYGTNGLTPEHISAITSLQSLTEIIFFFDGDKAGDAAVTKHSKTLHDEYPHVQISRVRPPDGEDVNSLAVNHAGEEAALFTHLLKERTVLFSPEGKRPAPTPPEKQTPSETTPVPPNPSSLPASGFELPANTSLPASSLELPANTSPSSTDHQPTDQQPPTPIPPSTPPLQASSFQLNTTNKSRLTYHTAHLHITIWGGVSTEDLGRLKVSLHVKRPDNANKTFRDEVNLYSHVGVKRTINSIAQALEVSTTLVAGTIAALTEQLETYRLKEREENSNLLIEKPYIMSKEEITQAEKLLNSKTLVKDTLKLITNSGLVGEQKNGLLLYFLYLTRFFKEPLHAIILGHSGSGKTYLQTKLGACLPEEVVRNITGMSENTLYYSPKDYWSHKVLLIEDLDGVYQAFLALRELMSKQCIIKMTTDKDAKGSNAQKALKVEGPVCVSGATTKEKIYEDNANRSFMLYVDESAHHLEEVMDYQRRIKAGLVDEEEELRSRQLLKNAQRLLKPIRVVNPYATKLKIPDKVFKKLRTNEHYLRLIEVITFYHQRQREEKKDKHGHAYIGTTLKDIEWANYLAKETLLRKSDELSGQLRSFFEGLKAVIGQRPKEEQTFYAKNIRELFRMNPMKVNRYLKELEQWGHIRQTGGNKKTGYEYAITNWDEYGSLKEGTGILDQILEKLKGEK